MHEYAAAVNYHPVLARGGTELADAFSESRKAMDGALALIHEKAPALTAGEEERELVQGTEITRLNKQTNKPPSQRVGAFKLLGAAEAMPRA